jgi:Protein of unknown function (DUF4240)
MLKYLLIIVAALSLTACGQTSSNNRSSKPADTMASLTKDQKMDTVFFWKILDYAFAKAQFDNKLKAQTILDQLCKLTPEQIQEFEIIFQQMNLKANTWNNMAAHTIIEGGSSDDSFFYFRCWLISLGKYHFEETLKNPDHLADIAIPVNQKYGYGEVIFEELIPMSDNAYQMVTKKEPTKDTTFPRAFAQRKGLFFDSGGDTKGVEWTDKDLPKIAPKLCKMFKVK